MNALKKYLGIIWMLLGIAAAYFIIHAAFVNIKSDGKLDINKPLPWIIIIIVFLPWLQDYFCLDTMHSKENTAEVRKVSKVRRR